MRIAGRERHFKKGDVVLLHNTNIKQKSQQPPWIGCFKIREQSPEVNQAYILESMLGDLLQGIHHSDHLKRFRPRFGHLAAINVPLPAPTTLHPVRNIPIEEPMRHQPRRKVKKTKQVNLARTFFGKL